jgi:hypothetical protein
VDFIVKPSAKGCKRRTDYNGTFLAIFIITPPNYIMGLGLLEWWSVKLS